MEMKGFKLICLNCGREVIITEPCGHYFDEETIWVANMDNLYNCIQCACGNAVG